MRRVVPLLVVLAVAVVVYRPGAGAARQPDPAARGEQLYLTGCVSCHGAEGEGVTGNGPTLVGVGGAAVDFYLSTGRMPAAAGTDEQPPRKPPVYDRDEIDALIAHVATFGPGGPDVPVVDVDQADLALGGTLFRANCASCHNAAGVGGALSYGHEAPSLLSATSTEVVEAMRVGPGQMPVFAEEAFTDDEAAAIATYVQYLHDPDDPGGFSLGSIGPVSEGFVALLFGLGGLVVISTWIVGRRRA